MQLRGYQKAAIEAVIKASSSSKRHLLVMPTGSGKTVVFCKIAEYFGAKTLVISHTTELVSQAARMAKALRIDGIESRSIQSLLSEESLRIVRDGGFELLVIDECHRAPAASYLKVIEAIRPKHLLGVTATPFRTDLKKLSSVFGSATYSVPLPDLIEQGHLCDFMGYRIKTSVDLSKIKRIRGDFENKGLTSVVNVKNRNEIIVSKYKEICGDEKALCFCTSLQHCADLCFEFNERGINAAVIHGNLSRQQRADRLKYFKEGQIRVLLSCQILTEGFDEPSITSLIMARPTCSKTLYMQMIGRGSRKHPGKAHCKVLEFTDNAFDVCCLEDLIEAKVNGFKRKEGESLKHMMQRAKKELEATGGEVIVEKVSIILKNSIYERPATPWQIDQLMKRKINFVPPITEFVANNLLARSN